MKKRIFCFVAVGVLIACVAFCSCKRKKPTDDGNAQEPKSGIVVENTISTDKEYMFKNYGGDYRWYETSITLTDYLDSETTSDSIASVSSVFQVVEKVDECYDTHVIITTHNPDCDTTEVIEGFWVEDNDINKDTIKVTFKEAYEKLMQANCVKPHSRKCVLRDPVGPVKVNPQYIFGNIKAQVYVDAVTGDVSDKCEGLNTPLGEWP